MSFFFLSTLWTHGILITLPDEVSRRLQQGEPSIAIRVAYSTDADPPFHAAARELLATDYVGTALSRIEDDNGLPPGVMVFNPWKLSLQILLPVYAP